MYGSALLLASVGTTAVAALANDCTGHSILDNGSYFCSPVNQINYELTKGKGEYTYEDVVTMENGECKGVQLGLAIWRHGRGRRMHRQRAERADRAI